MCSPVALTLHDVHAEGGGAQTVRIRDDSGGYVYPDDPLRNRGPHFNTENGEL